MQIEEIISQLNHKLIQQTGKPLKTLQEEVIRQCWEGKKYHELEIPGYSLEYIEKMVAPKLWKLLSTVTGEKVTKKNLEITLNLLFTQQQPWELESQILGDRYQILKHLSSNKCSKTYLAKDLDLNKQCIIKQLFNQQNPMVKKKFHLEAGLLYQLGWHPQIPGLLAHYEDATNFYLVYEYIEGTILSKKLPEKRPGEPWSEEKVIQLVGELLNILDFVHKREVIHRNIKPSKLIETPDNKIVLIDFSSIQIMGCNQCRNFLGTLGYRSPEQIYGISKPCSDIYTVGILGIQALTGIPPRQFKINSDTGEFIWRDQVEVTPEFANILEKMVRWDFSNRYQFTTEVFQYLKKLKM